MPIRATIWPCASVWMPGESPAAAAAVSDCNREKPPAELRCPAAPQQCLNR